MKQSTPVTIPFGRLGDLRQRPDADLIAVKPGRSWSDNYHVKRYASRLALESFLKNPGQWYALTRTVVGKGMLIHPAFELEKTTP